MKRLLFTSLSSLLFGLAMASILLAEDVERERPAGWENLVLGGRFMDRFTPLPEIGPLRWDTWGVDAVKPRHLANGIEEDEWSYWGGNIHDDGKGRFHMFVCRWKEDHPKGHMAWPKSEVVRAVSKNPEGPYEVADIIGEGHNPEMQPLKGGGYMLYAAKNFEMTYYYSDSLEGPWELRELDYDPRQRQIVQHMANNTFAQREDGSMLMVGRGGGVWVSETGIPPYKQITSESVYPHYDGRYEDPVVWKTNIQYHLIVNDWLGRIAYYMRSKDGVNWKLDAGEAYLPGIAKHADGRVEDWYKFERIKVLQDQYGRAYQANFAVCDTVKRQDLGSDNHSSKNICIPLTVGRLIEIVDTEPITDSTTLIRVLVKAENGFDPLEDIDIDSLRFGASEEVDFGRGSEVVRKQTQGKDLLLTFSGKGNGLTESNFAAKLLGKKKSGELLYGFARLPWLDYDEVILSSRFPEFSVNGKRKLRALVEVENFGQVSSAPSKLIVEYKKTDDWVEFAKANVPALDPYETIEIEMKGDKVGERNDSIEVRVKILSGDKEVEVLEGPVFLR